MHYHYSARGRQVSAPRSCERSRTPPTRNADYTAPLEYGVEPASEGRTRLVLTALGFGAGQPWKDVHGYFGNAWDIALDRLRASLEG